jgi:hypothetical protein
MHQLTLDTNVVNDLCWAFGLGNTFRNRYSSEPLEKRRNRIVTYDTLKSLKDRGLCSFAVPSQYVADYTGSGGVPPLEVRQLFDDLLKISSPSLSAYPSAYPIIYSDASYFQRIFQTAFPNSRPHDRKRRNSERDALFLYSHIVSRRDVFLTNEKAVVTAAPNLFRVFGIRVMSPDVYVLQIRQTP